MSPGNNGVTDGRSFTSPRRRSPNTIASYFSAKRVALSVRPTNPDVVKTTTSASCARAFDSFCSLSPFSSENDASCFSSSARSEEHTSELQSRLHLVCRLLLEKKKNQWYYHYFSQRLYVVIEIDYRHAPYWMWPEHIVDV